MTTKLFVPFGYGLPAVVAATSFFIMARLRALRLRRTAYAQRRLERLMGLSDAEKSIV